MRRIRTFGFGFTRCLHGLLGRGGAEPRTVPSSCGSSPAASSIPGKVVPVGSMNPLCHVRASLGS